MTCTQAVNDIGEVYLFLGVETETWKTSQFIEAANFAASHNIDTILIKVADGGIAWYGGLANCVNLFSTIKARVPSVKTVPYVYTYGDTYNAFQKELALYAAYLSAFQTLVLDMEVEYNNKPDLCKELVSYFQGKKGSIYISTWADPSFQQWLVNIPILNQLAVGFMPQEYNDFLAKFEGEYTSLKANCLFPTIMLSQDFGVNHPVAIVQQALVRNHTSIGIWEYNTALQNPNIVDQIVTTWKERNHMGIPVGWTDKNGILTPPKSNFSVKQGFRDYILSHGWDSEDVPIENEHGVTLLEASDASSGSGTEQTFKYTRLVWSESTNTVYKSRLGIEYLYYQDALIQNKLPPDVSTLLANLSQVAQKYE